MSELKLVPIKNTKLEEHLPYLKEWYNIGKHIAVAELFRVFDIIQYNNQRHEYQLYTVYINNEYAGVVGYESYLVNPSHSWLSWTFLLPKYRGKGYGKHIVNTMIDILKSKQYTFLFIDSVTDINTQYFYISIGAKFLSDSKTFRTNNPEYSKEILSYDKDPIYSLELRCF